MIMATRMSHRRMYSYPTAIGQRRAHPYENKAAAQRARWCRVVQLQCGSRRRDKQRSFRPYRKTVPWPRREGQFPPLCRIHTAGQRKVLRLREPCVKLGASKLQNVEGITPVVSFFLSRGLGSTTSSILSNICGNFESELNRTL
jgi:hypothetical protein